MIPRAITLIEELGLEAHPEGGYYREIFRSGEIVQLGDGRTTRSAITTIYFLLIEGTHSRWHRVASDEAWHFYEGDPLELSWMPPDLSEMHRLILGPMSNVSRPVQVIPARCWQAARPLGLYTLTGCTVGPGFDFADFELLDNCPGESREVRLRFPEAETFI